MYLTKNILEKLSHPKSFERGEKYYKQGRVVDYTEDKEFIKANVIGTDNYCVRISQNKWEHSCNCLAYRDDSFCKHEIAVLLTKLNGNIESTVKPKIKIRNYEQIKFSEDEFKILLEKQSKESLISGIIEFTSEFPALKKSLEYRYSEKDESYIRNVENMLNKSISSLKRIRYGKDYSNKIFRICQDIHKIVEILPVNKRTSVMLLNTGYKLTESLTTIDDSYGTIQNVIDAVIEKAVLFLNSASASDLDIFYEFISKKSSFDLDFKIAEKILNLVNNNDILYEFINKLERTLFRKDPDFNFSKETVIGLLMDYYETKNVEKYEELAKEYLELSILVKLDYIKFLYKQNRYEELIKIGMNMYDRYDIRPMINDALLSLGKISELIELLKKQRTSNQEIKTLSQMKNINCFWGSKEFEYLIDVMLKNCSSVNDEIDLLNVVERHSAIKDILLKSSQNLNSVVTIEKQALKFSLYQPELAVELYKKLVEMELKRIQTSSHYKPLIEYLMMIKNLGGNDFVVSLSGKLIKDFPTKKKLIEEIKLLNEPNENR